MRTELHSRYPGIRAFEEKEYHLFFGRREESRQLYSQIKTQNLVILFAKSGIGKSSLINASILPSMEEDSFFPIKMRFQNSRTKLVETFQAALAPYLDEALLKRNLLDQQNPRPWEYLRACRFERAGEVLTPVIIMDQFEEFFDHPLEDQNELVVELADMISQRLPNRIQDNLRSIPFSKRSDEDLFWHDSIPVKIVIAIRSDRIGLLDNLSSEIPSILQNRFQLKPLKQKAARQAIVEPALLEDARFSIPAFRYEEKVLEKILSGLSNDKGEIESFQLQLLCQYIEKEIYHAPPAAGEVLITEKFFKNEKGFEAALNAILNNYYENELTQLSEPERTKARKFIEEGLIVNGRRAGLTEGVEKENYDIEKPLLYKLLDSRLIRQENTHLGKSFEISHDTLVAPILASYEKRRSLEEQIQKDIAFRKERKRLMSAVGLAVLGFALAAISLVFYLQANQAKETAQVEREKVEVALAQFQEQQAQNVRERYNRYLSDGENFVLQNEFSKAIGAFELALQIINDYADDVDNPTTINELDQGGRKARALIGAAKEKENLRSDFEQLINEGEAFEQSGEFQYINAQRKYLEAQNLNYDNALAQSRLYQISGKLEVAFIQFVKDGDTFFKALGYPFALENYQEALRIKPNNQKVKQKINRCRELLK